MKNIAGVDLNLLVAFDALMRERNVTRAANRIGLAQPSMSNALSRLRALFDDELFVRTPAGMRPTPEADRISLHVSQSLELVERAINTTTVFDPANAEFTIRLAISDYFEFVFLPDISRRVREQSPGAELRIVPFDRKTVNNNIDSGEIDLAIGVVEDIPKRLTLERLFHETFVCVSQKNHPDIHRQLDIEAFTRLPHALMSLRGDGIGIVDHVLAERGLKRNVAVSTMSFMGSMFLVAHTDMIAVTPKRLAERLANYVELDIHPVPIGLEGFALTMIWGKGTATSPQQIWFRKLVSDVVAK